mmetsp:Transcript_23008/g.53772  ORF Transcript_23008/g.53772 Transcript_23008/m.53772 type:complete len:275 (+) Transcript_23008:3-827(+)
MAELNPDDDLDALLDSALEDFDVPPVPADSSVAGETSVNSAADGVAAATIAEATAAGASVFGSEPAATEQAFLGGAPDDAALQALADELCKSFAGVDGQPPDPEALEASVARTLEMLAKNAEELKGAGGPDASVEEAMKMFGDALGKLDDPEMGGMGELMKQLLHPEFIGPPVKEMNDQYPEWMEKNRSTLSPEDLSRYTKQQSVLQQMTAIFDKEPENFDKLMDLMQQMQECGPPPPDIVKSMAPNLEFDAEGNPILAGGEGGEIDPKACPVM